MKHEENVDVRLLSRIAKIDSRMKVIQVSKSQTIGIKSWGRIDFLCNHKGYRLVYGDSITIIKHNSNDDVKKHNREIKKQVKADKANNNMKKNHKKK